MQIYLNILALSIGASGSIGALSILRRLTRKQYSSRWICIAWSLLCIRMLLPIQLLPAELWMSKLDAANSNTTTIESEDIVSGKDGNEQFGTNEEYYADESIIKEIEDISRQYDSENNQLDHSNSESSSSQRNHLEPVLESIKDKIQIELFRQLLQFTYYIWIIGVILLCMRQIFSYQVFRKRIEKIIRGANSEKYTEMIRKIKADYHIKKDISCYCCERVKTPMLVGFFHAKIVLPQIKYEPQEMDAILRHELSHYKHHDTWKKFLLQSVKIIYWFCPVAYGMNKYAKEDMELYCDEMVIRNQALSYRKSYSMAILRTIAEDQNYNCEVLTSCLSNGKKETKHRILCILGDDKPKRGILSLTVSFLLILFLCNLCLSPMKNVMSKVISSSTENEIVKNKLANENESWTGLNPNQQNETEDTKDAKASFATVRKMQHIVLLGLTEVNQGTTENACPDCIILVSFNWEKQQLILTSISRNLHVLDESGKSIKLMKLFQEDQSEFYHQLQNVLGIALDGAISIDMEEFETVIDAFGGVEINLTVEEKEYLNKTNYITQKEYRYVTEGIQTLNGNQALGYARVRMVPTLNGANGEWGRGARHEQILLSLYQNMKEQIGEQQTQFFLEFMNHVNTTMELSQLGELIQAFIEVDWSLESE